MLEAIFLDIDGTLVSFETHQIPVSAIKALEKLKANGTKIFISTGRPIQLINNLQKIFHLIDGYITATGACTILRGQVIGKRAITPQNVEIILDYTEKKQKPCVIVGEKDLCVCRDNGSINDIFIHYLKVDKKAIEAEIDTVLRQDILQITPFLSPTEENELRTMITDCTYSRWHPDFLDITSIKADKGRGLIEICQHLQIDPQNTMAIGDGGNDITMIKAAGIGVAMANGNPELQNHADHVTASVDEDGIEQALKHYRYIS